jgi:hypothetical protein
MAKQATFFSDTVLAKPDEPGKCGPEVDAAYAAVVAKIKQTTHRWEVEWVDSAEACRDRLNAISGEDGYVHQVQYEPGPRYLIVWWHWV